MKCLIIDDVYAGIQETLSQKMDVENLYEAEWEGKPAKTPLTAAQLAEKIGDCDILIMRVDPAINADVLAAAKNLKFIGVCSVGLNHVNMEIAKEKGIIVQNAPGLNGNAVAELTIGKMLDKGYDLLLCSEDVDEFCLQIMNKYKDKEFKNINSGDLGLESEEEKKAAEEATTENQPLFDAMQAALGDKIKAVKVSTRLKDHPVCLSSDGPVSIEMEKVLRKQPGSEGVKSEKVLELNAKHPVFAVLKAAQQAGDTDKLNKYASILYNQALLIEGMPVDDPVAYAEAVCELMK